MPNSLKSLLPCPFCGSNVPPVLLRHNAYNQALVCDAGEGGCGTRGPYKPSGEEAITAWNTRAPIAEGGGDASEHIATLLRLKDALPTIGLNGWLIGVRALDHAIESLSRQGGEEVVYQYRIARTGSDEWSDWKDCCVSVYESYRDEDEHPWAWKHEARKLFTRASEAGDWVLVPREATDEMLAAFDDAYSRTFSCRDIYAAMIAAAPAPGGWK